MKIDINSEIFSLGASFPELPNNFQYHNSVYPEPDNIITTDVSNGADNTISIAKRFCWTPDCQNIGKSYTLNASIYAVDYMKAEAMKDTINFNYLVTPPFDSLAIVPTIFTPNGDGINDIYTLGYDKENGNRVGGVTNPCNDAVKVQIFNSWGMLVYESAKYPEFRWDGSNLGGKKVKSGTYFVLISGIYGNETITLGQHSITILD